MLRYTYMLLFVFLSQSVCLADDDGPSPRKILRDKGLRRAGSYWVLPGERELSQRLTAFAKYKRALEDAEKQKESFSKALQSSRNSITMLSAERIRLNRQYESCDDYDDRNKLWVRINEIGYRIQDLQRSIYDAERNDPSSIAIGKAKDDYVTELGALRRLVVDTRSQYEVLAQDVEVAEALRRLTEESNGRVVHRLGPRLDFFNSQVAKLHELEKHVKTEVIELRRRYNTFEVDVILNDEFHESMIFDTGASYISMSFKAAVRIGLDPSKAQRTVDLRVADGRLVEAKLMTIDTVQIGSAKIHNVECVVKPEGSSNAPMLLGGSFLRHFNYHINPDSNTLSLTRLEPGQERPLTPNNSNAVRGSGTGNNKCRTGKCSGR